MDDRARRLELVKPEEPQISSGVVSSKSLDSKPDGGITSGTLLEGKYLVGRVLGAGAVGIVYEAKNVELDETIAIKCLRPEMMAEEAMVGRFAREAKAAAAIKSEYVATVFDVGVTSSGTPYIVMEYLDGKDLGAVVQESGTIGPRTAVEYALQVCEALAVAHAKGVVHRDIKPENLLLTERTGGMRIVKVLDFGISKAALKGSIFKSAVPLVKTQSLMGTPLYMSPEQVRVTDSVDVRSDIWSLGMVIYEMLTGHTAFDGQSITEICAAILEQKPRPLEVYRNDLPSGLVEVVLKCLQKDVTKRYQNVAELALALMPFGPKRTRLNVERAVAVLQGAGQLSTSIQINSTMPPSPADFLYTPIPRAPGMPSEALSSSTAFNDPPSAPSVSTVVSAAPMSERSSPVASSYQMPVERKRGFGYLIGGLAVLAILAGAFAATYRTKAAAVPVATPVTAAEAKTSPPPPSSPTTTATAAPSEEPPTEVVAPGTASHAVAPVAPRPNRGPLTAGPQPVLQAPTRATTTRKPGTAKSVEKPAGTPEEPDLGY